MFVFQPPVKCRGTYSFQEADKLIFNDWQPQKRMVAWQPMKRNLDDRQPRKITLSADLSTLLSGSKSNKLRADTLRAKTFIQPVEDAAARPYKRGSIWVTSLSAKCEEITTDIRPQSACRRRNFERTYMIRGSVLQSVATVAVAEGLSQIGTSQMVFEKIRALFDCDMNIEGL